jgi:hypothetical protein
MVGIFPFPLFLPFNPSKRNDVTEQGQAAPSFECYMGKNPNTSPQQQIPLGLTIQGDTTPAKMTFYDFLES